MNGAHAGAAGNADAPPIEARELVKVYGDILAVDRVSLTVDRGPLLAGKALATTTYALLFDLMGILPGTEAIRPYLLSMQFNAWQGLLRKPVDWQPIIRAAWACALYSIPALLAAGLLFVRRDVDGG